MFSDSNMPANMRHFELAYKSNLCLLDGVPSFGQGENEYSH